MQGACGTGIGRKIGGIVRTEKQKSIKNSYDGHGVRFDVYFKDDEQKVYDIEMQRSDTYELTYRSRYYQSMIDGEYLERNEKYRELPDSYIIFLCTFDIFKLGYHKYSFIPKCREVEGLELKDGTDRIFICAGGDRDDVSPDMKSFIDYLVGKAAKSDLTSKIEAKVKDAIEKRLWRKEYMTYKEQMDLEYQKGIEEGIKKGIEKGATMNLITLIIRKMGRGKTIEDIAEDLDGNIEDIRRIYLAAEEFTPDYDVEKIYGRLDDLKRATKDKEYQDKLIKELVPSTDNQ